MGEQVTVDSLIATVGNKILALRSFKRQLEQEKFRSAYAASNESEKIKLNVILKSNNTRDLKIWISQLNRGRLHYMSYRQLRAWAQEESIPYWSRMEKDELIQALEKLNQP